MQAPQPATAELHPTNSQATGAVPEQFESQSLWEYMLEHIDEFPVAKAIVEHFDAQPGHLSKTEVAELDMIAIYLRAKVTIKRQQVAWAETQNALAKARDASKGLRGVARRFSGFARAAQAAASGDNGRTFAVVVALTLLYLMR